jgi:hypothetical protein
LAARLACTASNKSRARIGSCSPRCRLLENPVKLPFLNVELPLVAFFFLAPIIFIVSHACTLVHFVMLGAKVGVYDDDLRPQLVDAVENRTELAMPPAVATEMAKGFTLYTLNA